MKRFLIIVLVMLLILSGTCYADGLDTHEVENAVPDDARELAGDLDDAGTLRHFLNAWAIPLSKSSWIMRAAF